MVAYRGGNPKIFARNSSFVASRRIRGKNLEPFFLAVKKNPRGQYISKRECWYLTDWNPSKSLQRRILKRLCFCIVFHLNFVASFKKDFFFLKVWRKWLSLSIFSLLILQMVSAMQNIFTYLQKLAAGLEQVVVDQAKNNGPFLTEFDRAQYELKTVSYLFSCKWFTCWNVE